MSKTMAEKLSQKLLPDQRKPGHFAMGRHSPVYPMPCSSCATANRYSACATRAEAGAAHYDRLRQFQEAEHERRRRCACMACPPAAGT